MTNPTANGELPFPKIEIPPVAEFSARIYDDTNGDYIEIGLDDDSLGLISVAFRAGPDKHLDGRLVLPAEEWEKIIPTIQRVIALNKPEVRYKLEFRL